MYKLVRDDYKADKSILHVAHTHLMVAATLLLSEPNKIKEIHSNIESIVQLFPLMTEVTINLNRFTLTILAIATSFCCLLCTFGKRYLYSDIFQNAP